MTAPASPTGERDEAVELAHFRETFQLRECTPSDRLDALGFDSLGFLELLVYVEDRSGSQLDEAMFRTLVTVGDIVGYITRRPIVGP